MTDKEVTTDMSQDGLRDIAEGIIRFSISAKDREENVQIHNAFKEYCKIECQNNYTQGLKELLEYKQADFKYEMIYNKLEEHDILIEELRATLVEIKEGPKKEEESDKF